MKPDPQSVELVDPSNFCASLLIRGGRVIDPSEDVDEVADVLIENGCVRSVAPDLEATAGTPVLEAAGLVVAPGFIDSHVHLREPGFESKETIATGTAAAAAGGIAAVVAMPNTNPPPDTPSAVAALRQRCQSAGVRVYTTGCITAGRRGLELAPLRELAAAGVVAFSDDGDPVEDAGLMRRALEVAAEIGLPLFPHEEVKALTAAGAMHEGTASARLGVRGMPAAGEEQMIARDIELVRQTGGRLHLPHISTAGAADLVGEAKVEGLPVTCEVLPHHFILTDAEVLSLGSAAKMSPPLRAASDVEALLAGLADGTIDTIASDHAPHTAAEKSRGLQEAPFGIVGLETALGLSLTYLLEPGILSLAQIISAWSWKPAQIFGLPGGRLGPGAPGDATLLDPSLEWTVDSTGFTSRSSNTPFDGYELTGKAVATVVGGRVVHG